MRRLSRLSILGVVLAFAVAATPGRTDVKQKSMTKMDFKGSLGTVMKIFGAEKPHYTVEYVKGNLYRSDKLDKKGKKLKESDIIDLDRELFIHLNHKKKKYTQMTFQEWREMLEEAMKKLDFSQAEKEPETQQPEESEPEVKWSFKVDVETPGDKETIAGYEAEKVIVKMDVEAEGTQEAEGQEEPQKAKGGLKVVSTHMVCKDISGQEELKAFSRKLAEKLGMDPKSGGLAKVLSQVMQNNPELAAAMKKMREEGEKLDGVHMRTHTVFESWGESSQMKKEEEKNDAPTSVGGLFKKFGKKKKKKDGPRVLLETTTEIKEFANTPVSADLFVVPANYKLEKKKR